ncbi:type IV toxin-antitoxin system AbiEi family antitoxin domain-containing protein [Sphingobium mellinum]|uniref:type IV toxin-antitoxin system AbiEi family antitoxin domain-containing protein n=1 Tax=Sphingobium mellinum TaxID=1387166 RepID=UPI0030EBBD16
MSALADQVTQSSLAERIFSEGQLGDLLGGSDARRYALVHRALKDGSLIRLKRATYMLGRRTSNDAIHPFAVAQALLPGSYISFETALGYHGWIPEAVFTTASVSPGRKTISHDTPSFGQFSFHPLALQEYQFLTSVDREKFGKLTAFVAQPLRALIDLVALRKEHWSGLDWLTEGMRIDEDRLRSLRRKDFSALRPVYRHKAANEFLHSLEDAILTIKAAAKGRPSDD